MAMVAFDEQSILEQVREWDPARRLALAREILTTLTSPTVSTPARRTPPERLLGLLKTNGPPPADDECIRIVEEERLRKHR